MYRLEGDGRAVVIQNEVITGVTVVGWVPARPVVLRSGDHLKAEEICVDGRDPSSVLAVGIE